MKHLFLVTERSTGKIVAGPFGNKTEARTARSALNKHIQVDDESKLQEYIKHGHSVREAGEKKWDVEIITHVISPGHDHWKGGYG